MSFHIVLQTPKKRKLTAQGSKRSKAALSAPVGRSHATSGKKSKPSATASKVTQKKPKVASNDDAEDADNNDEGA